MVDSQILLNWLTDRYIFTSLLVGIALTPVIARVAVRAAEVSFTWSVLSVLSLIPIVALTIIPRQNEPLQLALNNGSIPAFARQFTDPALLASTFSTLGNDAEKIANILLFVHLAFFLASVTRAPLAAFVSCCTFSLMIELWQSAISRQGEMADVLHNSCGAALGILLVLGLRELRKYLPAKLSSRTN